MKAKYEPFGDELSTEVSYLQAAYVLDVAVQMAIECRDTDRLQNLALSWMELGKLLMNGPGSDDDEDDEDGEQPAVRVGFRNEAKAEKVDEQPRSTEADTPGNGIPRLHP